MDCPKCKAEMELIKFKEIEVDRCKHCKGIWFDMLEHEQLKSLEGSEEIDLGDQTLGKQYNFVRKITCPSCSSHMIAMVDSRQPHIRYEACTVCYGLFFDAGEFRDYKERTVLDFFRDLLASDR